MNETLLILIRSPPTSAALSIRLIGHLDVSHRYAHLVVHDVSGDARLIVRPDIIFDLDPHLNGVDVQRRGDNVVIGHSEGS